MQHLATLFIYNKMIPRIYFDQAEGFFLLLSYSDGIIPLESVNKLYLLYFLLRKDKDSRTRYSEQVR